MATLTFRNSQGELVEISTVAASRFKNEFGAIFEQAALASGAVAITKLDERKAVLLSYAEFQLAGQWLPQPRILHRGVRCNRHPYRDRRMQW